MGDDHFLERPGNSLGVGRMGKEGKSLERLLKKGTFPLGPFGWVFRMSPSSPDAGQVNNMGQDMEHRKVVRGGLTW